MKFGPPSDPRRLGGRKTPHGPSDHPHGNKARDGWVAGSTVPQPEPDPSGDRRDGYSHAKDLGKPADPAGTLALGRTTTGVNVARTAPTTTGPTLDPSA